MSLCGCRSHGQSLPNSCVGDQVYSDFATACLPMELQANACLQAQRANAHIKSGLQCQVCVASNIAPMSSITCHHKGTTSPLLSRLICQVSCSLAAKSIEPGMSAFNLVHFARIAVAHEELNWCLYLSKLTSAAIRLASQPSDAVPRTVFREVSPSYQPLRRKRTFLLASYLTLQSPEYKIRSPIMVITYNSLTRMGWVADMGDQLDLLHQTGLILVGRRLRGSKPGY
jgi:hypothetical protein